MLQISQHNLVSSAIKCGLLNVWFHSTNKIGTKYQLWKVGPMPGHHFSHFPNQKILGDEYFKSHAIKMFLIWLIWMNAEWWCRLYYHHHCRYLIINLIGICKLNWSVGENYRLYHNDLIMIQSQLARQVMGDKSGPVVFLSDDSRKPMNIHPCSNSIVPILGRSEYVKKFWNMYKFHFSCFFLLDRHELFQPQHACFVPCQVLDQKWVTFRGNLVSLVGISLRKIDPWLTMREGIPNISGTFSQESVEVWIIPECRW